jgi:predicted ATPase
MPALPAGWVTFMFTDIEGSTRLQRRLVDEFPALLVQHDELLGRSVEEHAGVVIKHMGDGLFAAFAETRAALASAIQIQHALAAQSWPGSATVRVRIGIHGGPAQPDKGDYVALAVNQAARVADAAHGGQVLVTHDVLQRLGQPSDGVMVRSWGRFRLKDFDEPVELHSAFASDMELGPPPRAVPTVPHNLPRTRTAFIGRERELNEVGAAITAGHRLVTIVGPGGIGKTRLASEVALQVASQFDDGAWFVPLANVTDDAELPLRIGHVLPLPKSVVTGELDDLALTLSTHHLLLVLDNCEHVVDATACVADRLVAEANRVIVVATSREPLRIAGELVVRLDPLKVPEVRGGADLTDALVLFLDRASFVTHTDEWAQPEMASAARICRRLDGVPLAIELAAARLRQMTVDELADRLDERLVGLGEGMRVTAARHQTVSALIDWSYGLLDQSEQRILRCLTMFRAPFCVRSAAVVCDLPVELLQEALDDLVDKSLVVRFPIGTVLGYRLLTIVRECISEVAMKGDDAAELADRHCRAMLELAEQWHRRYRIAGGESALDETEIRYDDVTRALDHALRGGSADMLASLALAVEPFWQVRGHRVDGRMWLLIAGRGAGDPTLAARALTKLSFMIYLDIALQVIDADEHLALQREAVDVARSSQNAVLESHALHCLASTYAAIGRLDEAYENFTYAIRLLDRATDGPQLADALAHPLVGLGLVAYERGQFDEALTHYRRALAIRETHGPETAAATIEYNIGEALIALGRLDEADAILGGLLARRAWSIRSLLPHAYEQQATIAARRGDASSARALLLKGAELAEELEESAVAARLRIAADAVGP